TAFTGLVFGRKLSDLGPSPAGPHERDGLRVGVDGRDGNGDLADGATVPDDVAAPTDHRHWHLVLEHRCSDWRNRNSHGLQHRLRLARVSALCRGRPFCRLRADYFVGGVDVPFSPWGSDLYHAMVFARRVSLVSLALRCRAGNALRGPGPRRDAGGSQLVVREYSPLPLVRRDRSRDRLLHDPESNRSPRLQLPSRHHWILDL